MAGRFNRPPVEVPEPPSMTELTNSSVRGILVDEIDYDLNTSRWSLGTTGYPRRGAVGAGGKKRSDRLHRIVGERIAGRPLTRTEEIDHINGNPLDNRRCNLRIANRSENLRNQRNRKNRPFGFVGVRKYTKSTYRAYLMLHGQQINVGTYAEVEEAAWMRDQWAIQLHGEFATLNFDYEAVRAAV